MEKSPPQNYYVSKMPEISRLHFVSLEMTGWMLLVVILIHCQIRADCHEALYKLDGDVEARLYLVDFRLFPFADDEVDLFSFGEVVADAEA